MRVLVTGWSGFVGRHLLPRLRDEVEEVVLVVREGATAAPAGTVAFAAPADLALLDALPDRLDAIIHLAALNPPRPANNPEATLALMRANADATARLAALAAEANVARFLFLSTANVHQAVDGRPVIEDDEPRPADPYAISKLAAEEGLRRALAGSRTAYTILRPPPVYGDDGKGGIATLARLAASRLPLPFGSTLDRRSIIAIDNLVDAMLLALVHPAAANEIFLVADADPLTTGELVALMREARGRDAGLFAMPLGLVRLAARAAGRGALAERLTRSLVVDHSRIRLRLGWRPRLSTGDALGADVVHRRSTP